MATNKIKATVINLEQEVPKSGGSPWLMISEKAAAAAMSSERPGLVAGSAQSLVGPKVSAGPAVAIAAPATGAAILDTIKGNTIVDSDTLIPLKITGIKVTGANQFDESTFVVGKYRDQYNVESDSASRRCSYQYFPVIGGATYYLGYSGPASGNFTVVICWYDKDKNFIYGDIRNSDTKTAPAQAAYMRISSASDTGNTCINLSNPSINGQYFPYEEYTLSLPVVGKTAKDGNGNNIVPFPEGMNGTPTVYDTATKAGGEVKWGVRAYEAGDESDATVITDLTHTAYPLDTPVPFTWDEPLEVVAPVAEGGVLWLQPEGVDEQGIPKTAPLSADIRWPFSVSSIDGTLANLLDALKTAGVISAYTMTYNAATGKYDFTIN